MKNKLPFWLCLGFGLLIILRGLSLPMREDRAAKNPVGFNFASLAEVPVQANGRIQPFDSVARNSLLILRTKSTLRFEPGDGEIGDYDNSSMASVLNSLFGRGKTLGATEWLAELVLHGEKADTRPVFRIDNDQVLGDLKLRRADGFDKKYFSFKQLRENLGKLEEQARLAGSSKQGDRDAYQVAVLKLYKAVQYYSQLKMTLLPIGFSENAEDFLVEFEKSREASRANPTGNFRDDPVFLAFLDNFSAFLEPARFGVFSVAPLATPIGVPLAPEEIKRTWLKSGEVLAGVEPFASTGQMSEELQAKVLRGRVSQVMDEKSVNEALVNWFKLSDSFRANSPDDFNKSLTQLRSHVSSFIGGTTTRVSYEEFFNRFEPFMVALYLYAFLFVVVAIGWLKNSQGILDGARALLLLTFVVHTVAIVSRMWIQGRPPVTNLYSSAVFIGWVACFVCWILELFTRKGFAAMVSATLGFSTLIIAHHLGSEGDTFEMMRAVLDSNFWLGTHVTTVTIGYAATFVVGFLGLVYIFLGIFTEMLDSTLAKILQVMVYGGLCFALLFSFVGTVLGGIWADDSWGRFWGWDPKENGAVMIVLWNALVLHARWGGLAKRQGLMALAVGGNIITAWSWFGTNMLGIGLHSYGFMDAAFIALVSFWASQFLFIGLAFLPARVWCSPAAVGLKENGAPETPPKPRPSTPLPEAL